MIQSPSPSSSSEGSSKTGVFFLGGVVEVLSSGTSVTLVSSEIGSRVTSNGSCSLSTSDRSPSVSDAGGSSCSSSEAFFGNPISSDSSAFSASDGSTLASSSSLLPTSFDSFECEGARVSTVVGCSSGTCPSTCLFASSAFFSASFSALYCVSRARVKANTHKSARDKTE